MDEDEFRDRVHDIVFKQRTFKVAQDDSLAAAQTSGKQSVTSRTSSRTVLPLGVRGDLISPLVSGAA